jgi:cytochrome c biogenesis protein CcdA
MASKVFTYQVCFALRAGAVHLCAPINEDIIQAMIAVWLGLLAGTVHVWSGPDHLAAIAPLAVRRPKQTWIPGAKWGAGHSAGVLVVGILSLFLRNLIPTSFISNWGERLVGVMLIAIGAWALTKAFRVHAHEHEHDGERHLHLHTHVHGDAHEQPAAHAHHTHAAFGIGILHGLAGTSHVLAVLPPLAMATKTQAISYLVAFGIGTVVSMATFSTMMGLLSQRFARNGIKVYRGLMAACSAVAIGVGCFWLLS